VDLAPHLERFLDRPRVAYIRSILDTYGAAAGGLLANGLAFSALFAVIPTVVLVLGLAGLFIDDAATQQKLVDALSDVFPPLRELLENILGSLTQSAALTSIVGFIGLLWTVGQFRGALDVAFARIFAGEPERDIVRRTLLGFAWVAILLVVVVGLIVVASLATLFDALIPGTVPMTGAVAGVLTSGPVLLALAVAVVMFVYRTLPPRAPAWSSIRVPAVIVGVIIVILTQVFTFLVPRLVGSVALAGSLAAAFIALAWFSFSFQALLYGASWVRVREVAARARAQAVTSTLGGPAAPAEPGGGGE
jgi:membrane protein